MSESEDLELKSVFQKFQSNFGESSNNSNRYDNGSPEYNPSRRTRNKVRASYKEYDVSGDELTHSDNHAFDQVAPVKLNNKDKSKSLEKDFDLFCENLSDTSVTGTSFTIDYLCETAELKTEYPTSEMLCAAFLREILCNLKPSHELYDKITYVAFLLNLVVQNAEFNVVYEIFHQMELSVIEENLTWKHNTVKDTFMNKLKEKESIVKSSKHKDRKSRNHNGNVTGVNSDSDDSFVDIEVVYTDNEEELSKSLKKSGKGRKRRKVNQPSLRKLRMKQEGFDEDYYQDYDHDQDDDYRQDQDQNLDQDQEQDPGESDSDQVKIKYEENIEQLKLDPKDEVESGDEHEIEQAIDFNPAELLQQKEEDERQQEEIEKRQAKKERTRSKPVKAERRKPIKRNNRPKHFNCTQSGCIYWAYSQSLVDKHEFKDHKASKLCTKCGFLSYTFEDYKKHNDSHNIMECDICQKKYMGKRSLDSHKSFAHKEQSNATKVSCDICGAIVQKYHIKIHIANVHGTEQLKCDICSYVANSQGKLEWHKKRHALKARECPECGLKFKSLKGHYRNNCSKNLSLSKEIHTCDICEKVFSTKDTLTKHKKFIHERVVNHHCEWCEYKTYAKFNLRMHISKMHIKEDLNKECPYCEQRTTSLDYHLKTFHWEEYLELKQKQVTE